MNYLPHGWWKDTSFIPVTSYARLQQCIIYKFCSHISLSNCWSCLAENILIKSPCTPSLSPELHISLRSRQHTVWRVIPVERPLLLGRVNKAQQRCGKQLTPFRKCLESVSEKEIKAPLTRWFAVLDICHMKRFAIRLISIWFSSSDFNKSKWSSAERGS